MSGDESGADPRVDAGLALALSARKGDPFYDQAAAGLSDRIEVLLDGDRLDHIVSYNVPAGVVVRHRRDWQGRMLLEHGAPVDEVLVGLIEVRWVKAGSGEVRHG